MPVVFCGTGLAYVSQPAVVAVASAELLFSPVQIPMFDYVAMQTSTEYSTILGAFYSLILSFVLSTVLVVTYQKTFQGLSYSRALIHTMILGSVVVSFAMLSIADNVARGLGMLGALSMIRFRSNVKDSRDLIFVFASLGIGIATGVHAYYVAVLGTLVFSGVALVISHTLVGEQTFFDGILRFSLDTSPERRAQLDQILEKNCQRFAVVTLRDLAQGSRIELAYQVKMRSGISHTDLVLSLKKVEGIAGIQFLLQETTIEI